MRALLGSEDRYFITGRGGDWLSIMKDCDFVLCPRGAGPTSYRLYESLQVENIPIYVWAEVRLRP